MLGQVGGHGELAPVEGGVADAVDAVLGRELEGDEVAPGGAGDDAGVRDLHAVSRGKYMNVLREARDPI